MSSTKVMTAHARLMKQFSAKWEKAQKFARSAVEEYVSAGEILVKIRDCCPHGEWGSTISRLGLTESTALRLCRFGAEAAKIRAITAANPLVGVGELARELPRIESLKSDVPEAAAKTFLNQKKKRDAEDDLSKSCIRAATKLRSALVEFEMRMGDDPHHEAIHQGMQHLRTAVEKLKKDHEKMLKDS